MKRGWIVAMVTLGLVVYPPVAHEQDTPPAGAAAQGEGDQPLGEEEAMVLNFERADIREVIHSLATALGISYTIDPRIEGQVTIRTTGKIAREDLFPLLNQILRNNGIAAVKVGNVYQILPVAEAKTRAIVPRGEAQKVEARSQDNFVIEILPLKHVAAADMVNILQPFVTPGGDVLSYDRANLLVVTDLQSNIGRLRELASSFDTDVFHNLRARVFKVKNGDPEELANELLGVLAPYGVTATGEGEGGVYVVPLSRLSSIVVVTFDPALFDEVDRWLRLLDIPPEESGSRQTFVYNVENAKAADLADVLNELFGGGPGGGGGLGGRAPGAPPAGVGLFGAGGVSGGRGGIGGAGGRRTGLGGAGGIGGVGGVGGAGQAGAAFAQQTPGAIGGQPGALGGGGRATGGRLGGRGGALGGAAGGAVGAAGALGAQGTHGISLPGGAAAAGGAPGAPGGGPPPIFKQEVRIVADEVTNSLVILATRRDYQLILDVLKRIDVVPRQVLLEVMIAEIALTKDLEFGVAWSVASGALNNAFPSNDPTKNIFTTGGSNSVGGLFPQTPRVPTGTPDRAFAVITDKGNFNVFLTALAARTNVKMLSAPHIIAADNREAHILVGDSIPILTSTATSTGITGTPGAAINSVQYRDTGKILTILPQVNSKGLVNMQIRQEVSAVGQQSFGSTNSPSFSTREAETTLVVQDGESVIIGGIIDDEVTHTRSGVPFFMDIPVIGVAFRNTKDNTQRTELILLITPYVIRTRDDAREVTDAFAERIQGLLRIRQAMAARKLHHQEPTEDPGPPPAQIPVIRPSEQPGEGGEAVPPEAAP
ncbi:MAG TPA: type II secretion system secretin GspD [Candidatus Nitrosopolaris sp.]|nr:type II secretion system secretin GspD [Candidatus Nitrosopolaris sp.]